MIDKIRRVYESDWDSSDYQAQQMGVAMYFIDKLALRAGHEKEEDEADTVGCCNLKVGTQSVAMQISSAGAAHLHPYMTWAAGSRLGGGPLVSAVLTRALCALGSTGWHCLIHSSSQPLH